MIPAPANVPVGQEERRALWAAAAGCFCLMCGYYMLRPIRDSLITEVGVRYNSILFTGVLICTAALLPLYWWAVGRIPRGRMLWFGCIAFVLIFLALAPALGREPRPRGAIVVYFLWITTANMFIVSLFWSAMADVWRPELAKRFYGYVAAGGTTGALLGAFVVTTFVGRIGFTALIVIACILVLLTPPFVSRARSYLRHSATGARVPDAAIPVGGRALDDLARLAKTPYLLGIAGLIIAGQTIGAFMYNEQARYLTETYAAGAARTEVFANLELAVNLLSIFFQAVVVTWLTRIGSVSASLSAMPVLMAASFIALALFPLGGVFLFTQVLRRSADYGLGKPPREMLFTVLNPESKFKSKSLIDTVLQRGSDTAAQWLYLLIKGAGLVGIAWMCAGLCIALLAATRRLGRTFETRQRAAIASNP